MDIENNYIKINPFMDKNFSMTGKKLIKLYDGSYFDTVRNWVYIEKQIFDDYGNTSYRLTMEKPYDLDNFHPVHNIKNS